MPQKDYKSFKRAAKKRRQNFWIRYRIHGAGFRYEDDIKWSTFAQIKSMIYGAPRREAIIAWLSQYGTLPLNCEGGIGSDDPDFKVLMQRKIIKISRSRGIPKWSKEFQRNHGKSFVATNQIRRSFIMLAKHV